MEIQNKNTTDLEKLLRDHPNVVYEHRFSNGIGLYQFKCVNNDILYRTTRQDTIIHLTPWQNINVDQINLWGLNHLHFSRVKNDLPVGFSGQELIDVLRANPDVKFVNKQYNLWFIFKENGFFYYGVGNYHQVIPQNEIFNIVENIVFVCVDENISLNLNFASQKAKQIDPIKLLHDNPDVVFLNNRGNKYRWHDYSVEYWDITTSRWVLSILSMGPREQIRCHLEGLVPYDSQIELKKKLEAVKLPEGCFLQEVEQDSICFQYKTRLFITHVSEQATAAQAIKDLKQDIEAAETRLQLLNILIDHNKHQNS